MTEWRQVPRDQAEDAIMEQLLGTDGGIEVPEGSTPATRADLVVDEMLERLAELGRWNRDAA